MLKKIDLLIIKAFIGPFLAMLFISFFVLTMQFFWLYIDDLVGKGLGVEDVLTLMGYVVLTWLPTALPLSLLLSSIITYGNIGESFELVAMKSAGISMVRIFLPLQLFSLFLAIISFIFSNNIVPYATLKVNVFKYDIIVAKPALDINAGSFYDKIDGYVIKLGEKEENDSVVKNITIFENSNPLQDNIIEADSGIMRVSSDKQYIEFILFNGWRYQERGSMGSLQSEFIRLHFEEYHKYFNISNFQSNKNQEKNFYDPKLLSTRQLFKLIDSFKNLDTVKLNSFITNISYFGPFFSKIDTSGFSNNVKKYKLSKIPTVPDSMLRTVKLASKANLKNLNQAVGNQLTYLNSDRDFIRNHEIELQSKFSLAFTCLVLFLIGAPLGAIIRKGGFGMPLVLALICFIAFHLLKTIGEKLVKSNTVSPFFGMWLGNIVLLPIAIILVYRCLNDWFSLNWNKIFRNIIKIFEKKINYDRKKNCNCWCRTCRLCYRFVFGSKENSPHFNRKI
ncbi:MAG: LptF/LptG family permease [Sediminibacterium sp.]|nr:LptF/LptG family permease [Sediminibacterium sp.]